MPECVNCRGESGFNRMVVEMSTETEIGSLCTSCEREEFGILLSDCLWRRDTGCALCPNTGHYALPLLECLIEYDDRPDTVEYNLTSETVELCNHHFHALIELPIAEESIARSDTHVTT